jgi:Uncharacterized protein conserved in bacteria
MSQETNDPSHKAELEMPASAPEATAGVAMDDAAGRPSAPVSQPEVAAEETKQATAPATKSSGGGVAVTLAVLVVLGLLGGGAYLTREQWLPLLAASGDRTPEQAATGAPGEEAVIVDVAAVQQQFAQQLDALSGRVASMEDNVAQLQQSLEKLAAENNVKEMIAAIDVVADRVTRLERTSADIAQLQREFGELNAKAVALREGYSALNATVLAANQLARAVDDGIPYRRPLVALQSVAPEDPEIAATLAMLEPHAESGIPTFASLRAQFPGVADAIARAAPTTGGEEWYHRALDKVVSLVTVRTTGDAAVRAGGVQAILAEAESALAGGDLATAVALLGGLEGPSAAAAADWLQAARLRLQAIEAVSRLQEQAATRLAQARG